MPVYSLCRPLLKYNSAKIQKTDCNEIAKSYMSAEHEVHYPSNARIMKVVLSCLGSKVSKTINTTEYCCGPGDIPSKVYMLSIASL